MGAQLMYLLVPILRKKVSRQVPELDTLGELVTSLENHCECR